MGGLTIDVQLDPLVEGLTETERDQIPFAASRTVNDLALLIQEAIRTELRQRFTIRQDYPLRYGIKIPRFAKKTDDPIEAQVTIPEQFSYWWKFQTGETKTPRGKDLAITASDVYPMRTAPSGQRPRDLGLGAAGKGINRTFVIDSGAVPGIYQRTGPGKHDIQLLFHFAPEAPTPVFDFYAIGERTVQANLQPVFQAEMTNALETAR